jgi:hypothetical protein
MLERLFLFLASFVFFGAAMGGVQWLISGDAMFGLIMGAFSGLLFSAAMLIFATVLQKVRAFGLRDIGGWAEEERIIKESPANMMRRGEGAGGKLFLTNLRIRFCSHRFNADEGDYSFSLASVQSVTPERTLGIIPNSISVQFGDGRQAKFVVPDRRSWIASIMQSRDIIGAR